MLCEREPGHAELFFDEAREAEIDVVAAEEQMLADAHSLERHLAVDDTNLDQREVGRAASDIADEDALAVRELAIERSGVRRNPGVQRSGWLFDQREVAVARRSRRFDRELAGFLVERGRHREHDCLVLEARAGRAPMRVIPARTNVTQEGSRRLDG